MNEALLPLAVPVGFALGIAISGAGAITRRVVGGIRDDN